MAKSFKQLPTDAVQPAKRTSEKDVLDFLEQDWLTPAPPAELTPTANSSQTVAAEASILGAMSNPKNTLNNSNTENLSNTSITNNTRKGEFSIPSSSTKKLSKPVKQAKQKASQSLTNKGPANELQPNGTSVTDATDVPTITSITNIHESHSVPGVAHIHHVKNDTREHDVDVRQTFLVGQQYLEGLKNFVHTKRMSGQYDFTQKQALHQALDLLFATAQIEERPLQIRQKEEVRRQQIRKGKLK